MFGRTYYKLKKTNGAKFFIRDGQLRPIKKELTEFLHGETDMTSLDFAKRVMFSEDIKTNNPVDGYGEDIKYISEAIKNAKTIKDPQKRARLINLYNSYRYILSTREINKDSLRELYEILSCDLLDDYEISNMGIYYRKRPVYIYKSSFIGCDVSEGISALKIDKFMESYFEFLNTRINGDETDEYIKSQILHLYLVYIHPYFDVNGRTSRTLAMWYLLNKKAYSYLIFNRGIFFNRNNYLFNLNESIETRDLTYFIQFMLKTVKLELEKEYIMGIAANKATVKLTSTDFQSLLLYLSMNGQKSIFDFVTRYNLINNHKPIQEIYDEIIVSLLDKGVLDTVGDTNDIQNKILVLRPLDIDPNKVKNLQI